MRYLLMSILSFALFAPPLAQAGIVTPQDDISTIEIFFSPRGGAQAAMVKKIDEAKKCIYLQTYSFTARPIFEALARAKDRGLDIQVILDRSHKDKSPAVDFFRHHEIKVYLDEKHAIAHNKIMLIDGMWTVTGSYNFTNAAEEKNAENQLHIPDAVVTIKYEEQFRLHRDHSKALN